MLRHLSLLLLILLAGCQPARRYGPVATSKPQPSPVVEKIEPLPAHWAFLEPHSRPDTPIHFVPDTSPEWPTLKAYWNHFPHPASMAVIPLGQNPLGAAVALTAVDRASVIKIKVPLGLPDPTPHVPAANPLTFAKWKLGQTLFADDRLLKYGNLTIACATCHQPSAGWTQRTRKDVVNPPTLVNAVYNKHQFWDGRATSLEEVLVRQLDDERTGDTARHLWSGVVKAVNRDLTDARDPNYVRLFRQAFGVNPTQDTIAKALATYLRTILSGDSLFDRAWRDRSAKQTADLDAESFLPHLDDATVKRLGEPRNLKRRELASALAYGYRTFRREGCQECHPPPLFTDHDFHNLGVGDSNVYPPAGKESGRFAHVPIGLKEARLIGAYRTPTLRDLPKTPPYFHDGSAASLKDAVQYFDRGITFNPFLARSLRNEDTSAKALNLREESLENLQLFLESLDGTLEPRPYEQAK